jgi:DNA-binding transcriptional MerR regulator
VIEKSKLTKRYYAISEVAEMFGVATSVLRYWEAEFKTLSPAKGRNGVRRYTAEDIKEIEQIHELLKNRGFTIEGAKKEIKHIESHPDEDLTRRLQKLKERLEKLRSKLDKM